VALVSYESLKMRHAEKSPPEPVWTIILVAAAQRTRGYYKSHVLIARIKKFYDKTNIFGFIKYRKEIPQQCQMGADLATWHSFINTKRKRPLKKIVK